MYYFYLDKILLPVAPKKLSTKIANQNKTINLINDGEINILKKAGLTEINFDVLLPNVKYPFAVYKSTFQNAAYFLENLEKLKIEQKPFQFIVSRKMPNGKILYDTNMKVSLEDYTINEDATEGFDSTVTIKLKQYKEYSTKTVKITIKQERPKPVAVPVVTRPATTAPSTRTYTVVRGDCLWNIAKRYYGNGSKYTTIYNANRDKIKNPSLIYPRTSIRYSIGAK